MSFSNINMIHGNRILLDDETPVIACTENQFVNTNYGKNTAMVEWEDSKASDNSESVSVICNPPSGANFTIGRTSVTCEAVDGSGNKAECSFQVYVTGNISSVLGVLLVWVCVGWV